MFLHLSRPSDTANLILCILDCKKRGQKAAGCIFNVYSNKHANLLNSNRGDCTSNVTSNDKFSAAKYLFFYRTVGEVSGASMCEKFIWKDLSPLKPFPVVAAARASVVVQSFDVNQHKIKHLLSYIEICFSSPINSFEEMLISIQREFQSKKKSRWLICSCSESIWSSGCKV